MVQYIYKIKNKDGLFSLGQSSPRWSEGGKCWSSLKNLRAHLKNVYTKTPIDDKDFPYHGCSIIRYELVELEVLEVIK